jgi:hypothetical protein
MARIIVVHVNYGPSSIQEGFQSLVQTNAGQFVPSHPLPFLAESNATTTFKNNNFSAELNF